MKRQPSLLLTALLLGLLQPGIGWAQTEPNSVAESFIETLPAHPRIFARCDKRCVSRPQSAGFAQSRCKPNHDPASYPD
ncbi:hypothetical protein [Spirosoma areae]